MTTVMTTARWLLPFLSWIPALFFNGTSLPALAASIFLLTLWLWAVLDAVAREGFAPGDPVLPITVLAFLLWLAVSSLFAPVSYLAWLNVWWVGVLPGTFLIAWLDPRRTALLARAVRLISIAVLFLALSALWQHLVLGQDPAGTFRTRNSLAALLNLIIVMGFAALLRPGEPRTRLFTAAGLFLLVLTVGVIQSRGAWLGLFTALAILAGGCLLRCRLRAWLLSAGVTAAAFACAFVLSFWFPVNGNDLFERAMTLGDVDQAGTTRFVIWEPAWQLTKAHPWTGIGLGSYFLQIPPLLDPADRSAHFYVHNDYLQLALETGFPGLLLFVLIFLAALRLLLRGLAVTKRSDDARLEMLGPFAALSSLAVHSFFTFNLFIVPTTLLAGLLLARFHDAASRRLGANRVVRPFAAMRPAVFRLLQIVLVLFSGWHALGWTLGSLALDDGRKLAIAGKPEQAHARLQSAKLFIPSFDSPWYTDADLLLGSARQIPDRPDLQAALLDEAWRNTEQALNLNPYRPQTYDIRARTLLARNPKSEAAVQEWKAALRHQPQYLPARIALAKYYLQRNRVREAMEILKAGFIYPYKPTNPHLDEYSELSIRTARAIGDEALAERLATKYGKLMGEKNRSSP